MVGATLRTVAGVVSDAMMDGTGAAAAMGAGATTGAAMGATTGAAATGTGTGVGSATNVFNDDDAISVAVTGSGIGDTISFYFNVRVLYKLP